MMMYNGIIYNHSSPRTRCIEHWFVCTAFESRLTSFVLLVFFNIDVIAYARSCGTVLIVCMCVSVSVFDEILAIRRLHAIFYTLGRNISVLRITSVSYIDNMKCKTAKFTLRGRAPSKFRDKWRGCASATKILPSFQSIQLYTYLL